MNFHYQMTCLLLAVLAACPAAADRTSLSRPSGVPPGATYTLQGAGEWLYASDGPRGTRVVRRYSARGNCVGLSITADFMGLPHTRTIAVGTTLYTDQYFSVRNSYEGRENTTAARFGQSVSLSLEDAELSCMSPPDPAVLKRLEGDDLGPSSVRCGETIVYHGPNMKVANHSGLGPPRKVKSREQSGKTCRMGCGEFRPLLRAGEYVVRGSSLNVRTGPSLTAATKFPLTLGSASTWSKTPGRLKSMVMRLRRGSRYEQRTAGKATLLAATLSTRESGASLQPSFAA